MPTSAPLSDFSNLRITVKFSRSQKINYNFDKALKKSINQKSGIFSKEDRQMIGAIAVSIGHSCNNVWLMAAKYELLPEAIYVIGKRKSLQVMQHQ